MLKDENWMELIPKSVADFILHIDGVNRVRELAKNDRCAI